MQEDVCGTPHAIGRCRQHGNGHNAPDAPLYAKNLGLDVAEWLALRSATSRVIPLPTAAPSLNLASLLNLAGGSINTGRLNTTSPNTHNTSRQAPALCTSEKLHSLQSHKYRHGILHARTGDGLVWRRFRDGAGNRFITGHGSGRDVEQQVEFNTDRAGTVL
jgi:hypothetical protein